MASILSDERYIINKNRIGFILVLEGSYQILRFLLQLTVYKGLESLLLILCISFYLGLFLALFN